MNDAQLKEFAEQSGIYPDMFISYSQYESVLAAIKRAYESGFKDGENY